MADILDVQADLPEEEGDLAVVDDEGLAEADHVLTASDVLGRIEELVAELVQSISMGCLPSLELVSRSRKNATYQAAAGQDHGDAAAGGNQVVALGSRTQARSLTANQGASAFAYTRVILVLQAVHELLRMGRSSTQRDLYYKLQQPPVVCSARDVDVAIQDVVALLRVPRSLLNITCASKGAVVGQLHLRDGPLSPWIDLSTTGSGGKAIPGDLAAIEALSMRCSARYLLIVEKDAVFQRLAEDGLPDALPLVMVTAKGMPDLATRAFCSRLLALFPHLTALGLVDYNPSGVLILRTYKYGSHRMGLESHRYALPGLHWLGLRSGWLMDVEERHLAKLTPRDLTLLAGLEASLAGIAGPQHQSQHQGAGLQGRKRRRLGRQRSQHGRDAWVDGLDDDDDETQMEGEEDEEEDETQAEGGQQEGRDYDEDGGAGVWSDGDGDASGRVGDDEGNDGGAQQTSSAAAWLHEVEVMEGLGYKGDIESVYSTVGYEGLREMVVQAVLRRQYI